MMIKIKRIRYLITVLIIAGCAMGCKQRIIVARVNDVVITIDELNKEVKEYNDWVKEQKTVHSLNDFMVTTIVTPPSRQVLAERRISTMEPYQSTIITTEQKIGFLKDMIRNVLLYQEALRQGLGKVKETRVLLLNQTKRNKRNILALSLLTKVTEGVKVSHDDVYNHYLANKSILYTLNKGFDYEKDDIEYTVVDQKKRLIVEELVSQITAKAKVVIYENRIK